MTVALSPLVKTAMAGEDVNWGRIMAALGRAGARFDPERVNIAFGPHPVVQNGRGLGPKAEAAAQQVIKSGPFTVTIHLNNGNCCRLLRDLRLYRGLHPHQRRLPELMRGRPGRGNAPAGVAIIKPELPFMAATWYYIPLLLAPPMKHLKIKEAMINSAAMMAKGAR